MILPAGSIDNDHTRVLLAVTLERHPSFRSVGRRAGVPSLATVGRRLRMLRVAGLVAYEDGISGTLRALVQPVAFGERS